MQTTPSPIGALIKGDVIKVSLAGSHASFRTLLTRSLFLPGLKGRLLFVGINPSTAGAQINDPTVLRWIHFTRSWGFAEMAVVNIYPFQASKPAECAAWVKQCDDAHYDHIMFLNDEQIAKQAALADLIVPCWGNADWVEPSRLRTVIHILECSRRNKTPLHCFGFTGNGGPKHPLARGKSRISNDQKPIIWRK